jgi:hypothetical protein
MTDLLSVLVDFTLNVVLVSLIPTGAVGCFLKSQKRRRTYPRGPEGDKELTRDCNVGLLGINGLFLLWLFVSSWPQLITNELVFRTAAVLFFSYFFYNRPKAVIGVPDTIIASVTWVGQVVDSYLRYIPAYSNFRRSLMNRSWRELRLHSFSGAEIGKLSGRQMLLTKTTFTCHSCGLEKDNIHLGDVLLDENNEMIHFCDEAACRLEARNVYAKRYVSWIKRIGDILP